MDLQRPASKQPMPANATRVFRGIIFDVYQWEQAGYDGKTRTFEKLKRADTAVVIPVTDDGKIIYSLQEQPGKKPYYAAFGGRVEEGEDVLEAAKRELLEESGFASSDWSLFDATQPASKIDWCIFTLIAKGCQKVADIQLDGGEKIDLHTASFEEFVDIVLHRDFAEDQIRHYFYEALLDPQKMVALKKQFSVS